MHRRLFIVSVFAAAATSATRADEMGWLSQASRDAINANITALEGVYQVVKPGLVTSLGSSFSAQPDDHLRFAFCALTAFDMKPYIASMSYSLKDLMMEDGLDCDNYVRLAWFFFQIMRPQSTSEVLAVGWEGGPIGNHAQMQIRTNGMPDLFCDPTIGLVVNGMSLDSLCAGFKPTAGNLYSIYAFNARTEIAALNTNVQSAILNGTYKASHLLYAYSDMTRYNALNRPLLGTYPARNG